MTRKLVKRALRIQLERFRSGKVIVCKVLLPKRFTHYGLGTFLEEIVPGEISITKQAYHAIMKCPFRCSTQGMELFAGDKGKGILTWFGRTDEVWIPTGTISRHPGANEWLEKCCVIEEKLTE